MFRTALAGLGFMAIALGATNPASAFEVSVPSVTTANPGGYANPLTLDTNRYRYEQGRKRNRSSNGKRVACSADSMPSGERRRMEARAAQIYRTKGKAAAVAYARQQGLAYHQRLKRQGICP